MTPRADDFRLERKGDEVTVVFTQTGAAYTFSLAPDGSLGAPRLSAPARPATGDGGADYDEATVRRTATELARLAVTGSPTD